MAYDDSRFRGEPGYRGDTAPGDTPAFGGDSGASAYQPGSYSYSANEYPSSGYPATDYTIKDPEERTDGVSRQVAGAPSLDDVFDDPTHGEPGRDRMGVHLVWELILLLAAAAVGYLLYRGHRSAVTGDGLRELMISTTTLGLLILGAGLSLRAAVPNLAVGPIALASSMFFAEHAHDGLLVTAVQTGFLAVAAGAIIALVVVGLHVPAWAASFGAGLAVVVWIQAQRGTLKLPAGVYQPTDHTTYWLGGFVILAFLGGLLGSIKSIRRAVGRSRAISDPADRRGGAAGAMAVVALLASSVLAAASGVVTALQAGQVRPGDGSLALTGLALGGALLAGTSAFGRRGGLFGAILAAVLLSVVLRYLDVTDRHVSLLAVAAAAIGVGLVATRLVEAFGHPRPTVESEVEHWRTVSPSGPSAPSDNGSWGGSRPTGWTSPLPASSADDRWGGDDTWRGR